MNKLNSFRIMLLIAVMSLSACSSDDDGALDTTAPVITLVEPTQMEEIALGEELHIDALLEDNEGLASYKIDIHNNFDGHTHGRVASHSESQPWTYSKTQNLEAGQQSFDLHEHIDVPLDITPGTYHLGIIVLDEAGNQSEAYVEVVLGEAHDHEDEISISNLHVEDVTAGSDLHAEADITSTQGIQNINVHIHGHGLNPTGNQVNWEVDQNFSNYTGTTAHFHEHLDVPQNATPGEYHLSISVTDEDGHTHSEGAHFMVN